MKKLRWLLILIPILVVLSILTYYQVTANSSTSADQAAPRSPKYVVVSWNNLGMHCYDPDYSNLAILPPYNTLVAQVIKVGDPPQIVTSG